MTDLLCTYAWEGKAAEVKELLPQLSPFGVNGLSKRGQTALYCAARQGHTETVFELLQFDQIDVDKPCPEHGGTPLHASGFNGYEEVTAMLLWRGANQFTLNKAGVSARAEARHGALGPYAVVTDVINHSELLKKYPFLKNLPKKSEREKGSDKKKDSSGKTKRTREKKPAGPKALSPLTQQVFVQDPDTGIHSLWKILTSGTQKLFLYFISNYAHRKTLDNLVLVNSLIRSLGYIVILIGSGTLETSAVFFKDYATLFPHQYQDSSLASFEVMGFKKTTMGTQLGGFTLISRETKTPQIIYEQREGSSEMLSLSETLSAAGASPEQIGGMTFLDEGLKKKSRETEVKHPGVLTLSDEDPGPLLADSKSGLAVGADKVSSGLKKTRKSLSFVKQSGKISSSERGMVKSPSVSDTLSSPTSSFEEKHQNGESLSSEPLSPRKPLSPRTSAESLLPFSKPKPKFESKPLPQPVQPRYRDSQSLGKLDSVKPLPQPKPPQTGGSKPFTLPFPIPSGGVGTTVPLSSTEESPAEKSLDALHEDFIVSPLTSPKTPGGSLTDTDPLLSPGGSQSGMRKSLSRPGLFRNMSQPSRSSVSSLQRSQIEQFNNSQPKES